MWGLLGPILEPGGSFFWEEFAIERGHACAQKYDIRDAAGRHRPGLVG